MEKIMNNKKLMKIILLITALALVAVSCKQETKQTAEQPTVENEKQSLPKNKDKEQSNVELIPAGYRLFEELHGDLNGDSKDDNVLIIKGTDKKNFVQDEYRGELDRNRRGIMIFLNTGTGYELALENRSCFSSENEDGGVYFPPELSVKVEKGNLYIAYDHGRYGSWQYTFRYRNGEFVFIGYDAYDREMPGFDADGREIEVVEINKSFNFLTKKVFTKSVTHYDDGEDKTDEKWDTFVVNRLVKLTDIEDFDEFRNWD